MDLMQPRMIQRIVDEGIAKLDMAVITQTGLLMIALALLGALGGVGCTITSVLASQGFGTDLRGDLFRKVQTLSFGNIDELETGQLITRLTNDITQVQEMVSMLLRIMVRAPLLLIGSLVMAILTSPRLALMFLVLIPLVSLILIWVVRKAYPLFSQVQERLDDVNTVMQENLAGVRVVKAFVRARHEIGNSVTSEPSTTAASSTTCSRSLDGSADDPQRVENTIPLFLGDERHHILHRTLGQLAQASRLFTTGIGELNPHLTPISLIAFALHPSPTHRPID